MTITQFLLGASPLFIGAGALVLFGGMAWQNRQERGLGWILITGFVMLSPTLLLMVYAGIQILLGNPVQ